MSPPIQRAERRSRSSVRACAGKVCGREDTGRHRVNAHGCQGGKAKETPAVSPCGRTPVSSTVGCGGAGSNRAGAPAAGYSEYSSAVLYVLTVGTLSSNTCSMRRCARVIHRLDRRQRLYRRTCGGVLGVLTLGYSGYSEWGAAHTGGALECRRSSRKLRSHNNFRKC